jgi:hypothetical protein
LKESKMSSSEWDKDPLVVNCDPETKLAVTAWALSKVYEHGKNPGSFRSLIYGLMGFGLEAYVPLYYAGGLEITNEFDLNRSEILRKIITEEQIDNLKLKTYAGLCNEPSCFKNASCGTPTETVYRWTCSEHAPKTKE